MQHWRHVFSSSGSCDELSTGILYNLHSVHVVAQLQYQLGLKASQHIWIMSLCAV